MKKLIFLLPLLLSIDLYSQQAILEWHDYVTDSNQDGLFIQVDSQDRIYSVTNLGHIMRYDKQGNIIWNLPNNTLISVKDMIIDSQDNLIFIGQTSSTGGVWWAAKYDSLSNQIWYTTINGPTGNEDVVNAVDIDENDNIYITGREGTSFYSKFYTVKLSTSGSQIWAKQYTGPYAAGKHEGVDIAVQNSNNIFAVGFEYRNSVTTDVRLIKYNSLGDTVWTRMFSFNIWASQSQQTIDRSRKIVLDAAGNIYISVFTYNSSFSSVIKYDMNGNFQWCHPVNSSYISTAYDLVVDDLGNSYTTGIRNEIISTDPLLDSLFVEKLLPNGTPDFVAIYPNNSSSCGKTLNVIDGMIYVGGVRAPCNGCEIEHLALKFDEYGSLIWDYLFGAENISSEGSVDMAFDSEGGIYLTGNGDAVSPVSYDKPYNYKLYECSPNLFSDTVESCGSYFWTENNQTYSNSGDYQINYQTAGGCDSIVKLNLTIHSPDYIFIDQETCQEFFWLETGTTYSASGTYQGPTYQNSVGCDSTNILVLLVNNVDETISDQSSTLIANQNNGVYQWVDCNNGNSIINGEESQSFTAAVTGNYACIVTIDGCTDTSACTLVEINDIDEINNVILTVFPNPVNTELFLSFNQIMNEGMIEILDCQGKILYQKNNLESQTLDVHFFNDGIYFLRFFNDEICNSYKFTVQH